MKSAWKVLVAAGALLASASAMRADSLIGGDTAVTLNSGTATTLTSYFSLGVVPPTTLTGLTATFPIVADTPTTISHSGGLSLTGVSTPTGVGTTVDVENFIIDTSVDKIFGSVVVNGGTPITGVALFDFDSSLNLTLDSVLAGDISGVFGVSGLSGVPVGTASINPATTPASVTPEPSSLSLLALGVVGVACLAQRRFANAN